MTDGKMLFRAPCKNVNFGIFYGLTAEGLYDLMLLTYATAGLDIPDWLTLDWCDNIIEEWFGLYPRVKRYMDDQFYRAARYGIAWTLLGRIRRIPEVRSVHTRIVAGGQRQAGNSPIQGTQADLNKIGLAEFYDKVILRARREGIAASILINVHDEIVFEHEEGYGDLMIAMGEDIMSQVMVDRETGVNMCAVPIVAEGHVMSRWQK
jgi:DNA polymerase-1